MAKSWPYNVGIEDFFKEPFYTGSQDYSWEHLIDEAHELAEQLLEVMKQLEWEDKDRCYLAFRRLGTIRIMDRISALELLKEDLEGERREEE